MNWFYIMYAYRSTVWKSVFLLHPDCTKILSMLGTGYFLKINSQQEEPMWPSVFNHEKCWHEQNTKKRRCKISLNKKWFDKECRYKRHELRKLSNQKHRNPLNSTLRKEYRNVLKQYKNLWNIRETNTIAIRSVNLKIRSKIRTAFGTVSSQWTTLWRKPTPLQFLKEKWMSHFQSLHSNEQQEAIIDELQNAKDITTRSHFLDYLITESEIRTAAGNLKNNKSSFSEKSKTKWSNLA